MPGFKIKVITKISDKLRAELCRYGKHDESKYSVCTMDFAQINKAIRDGFVVEPQGYESEFIIKQFENALENTINLIHEELACFDSLEEDSSCDFERIYWQDELITYQEIKQVFEECQISNLCNVSTTLEMLHTEYDALTEASDSLMNTTLYNDLLNQIEQERTKLRTKVLAFETLNEFLLCGEIFYKDSF